MSKFFHLGEFFLAPSLSLPALSEETERDPVYGVVTARAVTAPNPRPEETMCADNVLNEE